MVRGARGGKYFSLHPWPPTVIQRNILGPPASPRNHPCAPMDSDKSAFKKREDWRVKEWSKKKQK